MSLSYANPVLVKFRSSFKDLSKLLGDRKAVLLTTPGTVKRGVVEQVRKALDDHGSKGRLLGVCSDIPENPTVQSMTENADLLRKFSEASVIIALGGGSVMDSAKGVASLRSTNAQRDWLDNHLRGPKDMVGKFPSDFKPPKIIAIPTTAGTGSEVTMWGTVWDELNGDKYSISHPSLYPEAAVLIPELTLTCPSDLTASTGLDALSHSMESLWNVHRNVLSEAAATTSIRALLQWLVPTVRDPSNLESRSRMLEAAMLGGMAISSTKTAICHSMSYPVTSKFGMPHGLACSFTLPQVLRFNAKRSSAEKLEPLLNALNVKHAEEGALKLEEMFRSLQVKRLLKKYVPSLKKLEEMEGELINPARAGNNLVNITTEEARDLLLSSYSAVDHLKM